MKQYIVNNQIVTASSLEEAAKVMAFSQKKASVIDKIVKLLGNSFKLDAVNKDVEDGYYVVKNYTIVELIGKIQDEGVVPDFFSRKNIYEVFMEITNTNYICVSILNRYNQDEILYKSFNLLRIKEAVSFFKKACSLVEDYKEISYELINKLKGVKPFFSRKYKLFKKMRNLK